MADKKDTRPYWQQRRDLKNKAPHGKQEKEAERKKDKQQVAQWFGQQALNAPSRCENCGANLQATVNFHPRAHICHILAKTKQGGCPSVATHPQNRWFGCLQCHDGYDQMMAEGDYYQVVQMKVWPTIVERFLKVLPSVAPGEHKNIPEPLLDAVQTKKKK